MSVTCLNVGEECMAVIKVRILSKGNVSHQECYYAILSFRMMCLLIHIHTYVYA